MGVGQEEGGRVRDEKWGRKGENRFLIQPNHSKMKKPLPRISSKPVRVYAFHVVSRKNQKQQPEQQQLSHPKRKIVRAEKDVTDNPRNTPPIARSLACTPCHATPRNCLFQSPLFFPLPPPEKKRKEKTRRLFLLLVPPPQLLRTLIVGEMAIPRRGARKFRAAFRTI